METTVASSAWQKSKLLVKGLIIAALVLFLLIPTWFVQQLVLDRESRQKETIAEVTGKWAAEQEICGPILRVPYYKAINGKGKPVDRAYAYFLPNDLNYDAQLNPEEKSRSIYQVMLYSSKTKMKASFEPLDLEKLGLQSAMMDWSSATLLLGVSDAKGLQNLVKMNWQGDTLSFVPTAEEKALLGEGFEARIPNFDPARSYQLTAELSLNGSGELRFVPLGESTHIQMNSSWQTPSFTGSRLPVTKANGKTGFPAEWNSLAQSRKFPQSWTEAKVNLSQEAVGAGLYIPVNEYLKVLRSVKYAVLILLLTFVAFFLIETSNNKSVHPVQYALIGFALILFYTLLLSFSEYIGFNAAYAVAALATIGLITWFVKGLLQSGRLSTLLMFVLMLLYSYLFTLLQLEDYALLLGSLGLFITLAIVMHFSKRLRW